MPTLAAWDEMAELGKRTLRLDRDYTCTHHDGTSAKASADRRHSVRFFPAKCDISNLVF